MKSIINSDKEHCYLCGRTTGTDEHHVYEGCRRQISERYGLKVHLCRSCHSRLHNSSDVDEEGRTELLVLKQIVQKQAMDYYCWDFQDWITNIGKNYL